MVGSALLALAMMVSAVGDASPRETAPPRGTSEQGEAPLFAKKKSKKKKKKKKRSKKRRSKKKHQTEADAALKDAESPAAVSEQPPAPAEATAADGAAPAGSGEVAPTEGAPDTPSLLTTVFMGIRAQKDVDPKLAEALDAVVQGQIAAASDRKVIGTADIAALIDFEAEKQALGCDADSCLAELANALDADRVISGTMDKLGSGYFVVLAELDARTVAVAGRVQRRVSTDEDALIDALTSMARELVQGVEVTTVGTLIVTSEPPAEVFVNGASYGGSPAVIDDLAPGDVSVELVSGEDRVKLDAPVVVSKSTTINAKIGQAVGPTTEQMKSYASDQFWSGVFALVEALSAGGLILCCAPTSAGIGAAIGSQLGAYVLIAVALVCGGVPCIAGGILATLSLITFLSGPDDPTVGDPKHTILVTPPSDLGAPTELRIDPKTGAREEFSIETGHSGADDDGEARDERDVDVDVEPAEGEEPPASPADALHRFRSRSIAMQY